MATKAFLRDRKRGREGQNYVAGMFESWGLKVRNVPDGFFQPYDLEVAGNWNGTDVRFKVEVKHDFRASDTGNLCLELDALRHSQAGILTIVTDNPRTIYMLPLEDALKFAESYPNKLSVGERGEYAALVPKEVFISALKPKVLMTKNERV
ncbi:MAG: hypothetical protein M3362_23910 [Acidobacteriota bacterium]|nr:hypothetical protein [Acidobacteriota bacterium]